MNRIGRLRNRGFTLIELLIVVAILGILAAIAVPNFLNAQTRAKVSRCLSDEKSLATAVQSFTLDRNMMLVDIRDDDTPIGVSRIQDDFDFVGMNGNSGNRNNLAVLSPLTTPVSYMASLPVTPFIPKGVSVIKSGNNEAWGRVGNDVYAYWDNDPQISTPWSVSNNDWNLSGVFRYLPSWEPWDFILISFGPGMKGATLNSGVPYTSTNGLNSRGEIWLTNYGLISESAQDRGTNQHR